MQNGITDGIKLTCRWAIALNIMRLFSQSMLFRTSPAEGMKQIISSRVENSKMTLYNSLMVVMVPKAVCTYISQFSAGILAALLSSEL